MIWSAARSTTRFKHWVKQHSETAGELHIIARMSKPCCAQLGGISAGKKFGLANSDGWRGGIGIVRFALQSTSAVISRVRDLLASMFENNTYIIICMISFESISRKDLRHGGTG